MNDDIDDLDRALFALELEPAPAGLRAAILGATVYAPRAAAPSFAPSWQVWLVGAVVAVAVWCAVAVIASHVVAATVSLAIDAAVRALADPATLAWLSVGAVVTAATWYASDGNLRFPSRGARS